MPLCSIYLLPVLFPLCLSLSLYTQHSPPDSAEQQGFLRVEQMSPSLNNHASSSQEGSLYVPHSPPLPSSHPPVHMPPSLSGIDWKREQAKQHRTSVPRRSSEPVAAAGKSVPMRSASPKLAIQGNRTVPKSGGVQASSRSKRSHKTGSQSQVRGDSITQSSTVHCSTATTSSPSLARKLFHSNTLDSDTSTNSSKSQKEDQPTEATAPILKSLFAQVSSAQSSTEGEPHPLPAISAADLERQMHMEVPSPDGQTGVDFKYAGEAPTERNMCVPISISVLTDKSSVQPQLLQPSAFSAQLSASEQTGLVVSKTSGAEVNVVVQPPTPLASEPTQPVFSSGSDSSQTLRSLVQIFPSIPPLVHSPGMTAAPKSSSKHTVECPVSRVPEGNSEQAEHRMASPSSGGDCNNNSRAVSPELLAPHRAVQVNLYLVNIAREYHTCTIHTVTAVQPPSLSLSRHPQQWVSCPPCNSPPCPRRVRQSLLTWGGMRPTPFPPGHRPLVIPIRLLAWPRARCSRHWCTSSR